MGVGAGRAAVGAGAGVLAAGRGAGAGAGAGVGEGGVAVERGGASPGSTGPAGADVLPGGSWKSPTEAMAGAWPSADSAAPASRAVVLFRPLLFMGVSVMTPVGVPVFTCGLVVWKRRAR